jgi:hypothetical protein
MEAVNWLVVAHGAATLFMTGLVWFVQTVHYPLFARVERGSFPAYEREHQRRTTWIVAPWMLVEALTGALLLGAAPLGVPLWMPVLGMILLALVWLSTGLLVVPGHGRPAQEFDQVTHRLLVQRHTARTALWSLRAVLAVVMIQLALDAPSGAY